MAIYKGFKLILLILTFLSIGLTFWGIGRIIS